MKLFDELSDSNFEMYAIRHYDNPSCLSKTDFEEDLKRFRWVQRLFNRYVKNNDLQLRLILNHIIVIYNVFDSVAATRMLFFKIVKEQHYILKTFLLFLNKIPDNKYTDIGVDIEVVKKLQKL